MLLPPLSTQAEYVSMAEAAGLAILHPPQDISQDVAKTWYVLLVLHTLHFISFDPMPIPSTHSSLPPSLSLFLPFLFPPARHRSFVSTYSLFNVTWCTTNRDISWSLISSPSLWAFAIAQGRDGLAFLQAFRAMRRGYANGSFRYAVMAFEKS